MPESPKPKPSLPNTNDVINTKENSSTTSLTSKTQNSQSNYSADLEQEMKDTQAALQTLQNDYKSQKGIMALNGIYGYVTDRNSGDKVYLSLTPYEISPRLGDPGIFKVNLDDISDPYINNKNINSPDMIKSLTTALTVSNRLSGARVTTNFMQEVLSPSQDPRYTSKDDRIGQVSRMLSENGEEQDRSAFMHVVPDVEESGGKIPITYTKVDKEGKTVQEDAVAYLPVNFNFINSAYTLTIKEFILSNISEANQEIYTLDKTFDGVNLRFFGSQPKIFTFTGLLTNFDDDTIGVKSGENKLVWNGKTFGSSSIGVSSKGSMRDTFMSYYQNFLAGTKCKDFSMKLYIYYNWKIVEGYLVNMNVNTSAENDNVVSFTANMIVKREYNVFEAGRGLASNIISLSGGPLNTQGNKAEKILSQTTSYRSNYRKFAIDNTLLKIQESVTASSTNNNLTEGTQKETKTSIQEYQNSVDGFFKDCKKPDESYWFNQMCLNIDTIIVGYSFDPAKYEVMNVAANTYKDRIGLNPANEWNSLAEYISNKFASAVENIDDIWIKVITGEEINNTSQIVKTLAEYVMTKLKTTPNVTDGRRSNYSSNGSTLKELTQMQNAAYYTFLSDSMKTGLSREEAVNKWLEKYEEDGSKKG